MFQRWITLSYIIRYIRLCGTICLFPRTIFPPRSRWQLMRMYFCLVHVAVYKTSDTSRRAIVEPLYGICMLCHRDCLILWTNVHQIILYQIMLHVSTAAVRSRSDKKRTMEWPIDEQKVGCTRRKLRRWERVKLEHGSWYYGMQQRTSLLGAWGVRMGPWGWNNKTKAVANRH